MTDFNQQHNRAVWFDIPVRDLDRSIGFYSAVLNIPVHRQAFGETHFAVLEHHDGNGGCLVLNESEISSTGGVLVYLNVQGRIRDAVVQVDRLGGKVIVTIHNIGPHGFRAVILDSEGNRIALHSMVDA